MLVPACQSSGTVVEVYKLRRRNCVGGVLLSHVAKNTVLVGKLEQKGVYALLVWRNALRESSVLLVTEDVVVVRSGREVRFNGM
jgi:hypothetical protein